MTESGDDSDVEQESVCQSSPGLFSHHVVLQVSLFLSLPALKLPAVTPPPPLLFISPLRCVCAVSLLLQPCSFTGRRGTHLSPFLPPPSDHRLILCHHRKEVPSAAAPSAGVYLSAHAARHALDGAAETRSKAMNIS